MAGTLQQDPELHAQIEEMQKRLDAAADIEQGMRQNIDQLRLEGSRKDERIQGLVQKHVGTELALMSGSFYEADQLHRANQRAESADKERMKLLCVQLQDANEQAAEAGKWADLLRFELNEARGAARDRLARLCVRLGMQERARQQLEYQCERKDRQVARSNQALAQQAVIHREAPVQQIFVHQQDLDAQAANHGMLMSVAIEAGRQIADALRDDLRVSQSHLERTRRYLRDYREAMIARYKHALRRAFLGQSVVKYHAQVALNAKDAEIEALKEELSAAKRPLAQASPRPSTIPVAGPSTEGSVARLNIFRQTLWR